MNNQRTGLLAATVLAVLAAPAARAIDVTAGAWTLSFDGNVNANYIYSNCNDHNDVAGGLACVSGTTSDNSSAVSNGLLPAHHFGAAWLVSRADRVYELLDAWTSVPA